MSDFASLLQQLDKTAKRVSRHTETRQDERKRPRTQSQQPTRSAPSIPRLPRDHSDMRVSLSFVCIGAQKGGTTWLHEMLCKIPELGLPSQKELHFWDWHRRKGLGWYSSQFPTGRRTYGEITPCYMALSDKDIGEVRSLFPSVRIIFLARDLVERSWSAMTMELRNAARGMEPGEFHAKQETMDVATKNRIERESDPDNHPDSYFMHRLRHATHKDRSDYAGGLKRWLSHFPKEQLLILDYRLIASEPEKVITQVLEHIGVKDVKGKLKAIRDDLGRRVNASPGSSESSSQNRIRPGLRRQMQSFLRPFSRDFNALLKDLGYDWTLDEYE